MGHLTGGEGQGESLSTFSLDPVLTPLNGGGMSRACLVHSSIPLLTSVHEGLLCGRQGRGVGDSTLHQPDAVSGLPLSLAGVRGQNGAYQPLGSSEIINMESSETDMVTHRGLGRIPGEDFISQVSERGRAFEA